MINLQQFRNVHQLPDSGHGFLYGVAYHSIQELYEKGLITIESSLTIGNVIYPIKVLTDIGLYIGKDDLHCDLIPDRYQATFDEYDYLLYEILREQIEEDRDIFNGTGFKLRKFHTEKINNKERLLLLLQPTNYYSVISTNFILNKRLLKGSKGKILSLREKYNLDLNDLDASLLGNMLGTSILLILREKDVTFAVLVMRSEKDVSIYRHTFQVSSAGYVSEEDTNRDGQVDVFLTAQREIREELGIELPLDSINYLGIGIDLITGEPELFGTATIDLSRQALNKSFRKAKDHYENEGLFFAEFDPKTLSEYLIKRKWAPASAACCIYTLIRQYGREETTKALMS